MRKEIQKSVEQIRDYLKTAELFGEDEFFSDSVAAVVRSPVIPRNRDSKELDSRLRGSDAEGKVNRGLHVDSVVKEAKTAARPVAGLPDPEHLLRELYAKYSNCQRCSLCRSRKKIVFGVGSARPVLLLVGEGPGYEEDRTGEPFVGKAGQLLDKILAAIGLSRREVYITNIVKCHPMKDPDHPDQRGNDRPPMPMEIDSCREILNGQIEILNPPVICALGSPAAKALLGTEDGITRLRGKIFNFAFPSGRGAVPLVPTYHPAAVLRNESLKKDVWHDMKIVRDLVVRARSA